MRPEERIHEREAFARGFAVHVGIDAGKTFHKLVACGPDRVRTKAIKVDVSHAGFLAAIEFLTTTFPAHAPSETLIAIEFGGHYGFTFAQFLRQRGFMIVTMPAVTTRRLREIEDNSPRKDDAKDAAQVCKLVGAGLFVNYADLTPLVAEMRTLTTERQNLAVEETALRNRLRAILDLAWPEFQALFRLRCCSRGIPARPLSRIETQELRQSPGSIPMPPSDSYEHWPEQSPQPARTTHTSTEAASPSP